MNIIEKSDSWAESVVPSMSIRTNRGISTYNGRVLSVTLGDADEVIQFELSTIPFLRTEIQLSIVTDDTVFIRLEINKQILAERTLTHLPQEPGFRLFSFRFDVTEHVACVTKATLTLTTTPTQTYAQVGLFLGAFEAREALHVSRKFSLCHFLTVLLIHVPLWLVLLESLFLISAHLPFLVNVNREFAAGGSALIWLATLLGLPDLVRLPVREYLSKLACYVHQSNYRIFAVMAMVVLLAIPVVYIGNCMVMRYQYTSKIDTYLSTGEISNLMDAFRLFPQRLEAMLLFENKLLSESTESAPNNLRRIAHDFISNKLVTDAVEGSTNSFISKCSYDHAKFPLSPELWYATVLPMAESHESSRYKRDARQRVGNLSEANAKLFADILDLELHTICTSESEGSCPERTISEIVKNMESLANDPSVHNTHIYQEALDHMAQSAIAVCDVDRAIEMYNKLLDERRVTLSSATRRKWLRTARKLSLFHVFRALRNPHETGETIDLAKNLIEKCPTSDLRIRIEEELYDVYDEFQDPKAWFGRTYAISEDENIAETVKTDYSTSCWRY